MEVIEAIKTRRSIRCYENREIDDGTIAAIIDAARWAPSGKNTQPWRFVIVTDSRVRAGLEAIRPEGIIRQAPVCVAVVLERTAGYEELKDLQGIGACAQTLLLAAHALGIGSCWIGLARDARAHALLGLRETEELMLLVSLGYPAGSVSQPAPARLEADVLVRHL